MKYSEITLFWNNGIFVTRFSAHDCTLAEAQERAVCMGYTVPSWWQWWRWSDLVIYTP